MFFLNWLNQIFFNSWLIVPPNKNLFKILLSNVLDSILISELNEIWLEKLLDLFAIEINSSLGLD